MALQWTQKAAPLSFSLEGSQLRSMQAKRNTATLVTAGLASAFLFGAATPASKALLAGTQAQALAGLLYLGAAFGVLPLVIRERTFRWPWRAGRRTFLLLTGAIVLGGILGPLLLLLGLRAASSGSVSLWLNLEFVATVILGHFVFREHLTPRGWIAAGGTLIAVVLLAGGEGGGGNPSRCPDHFRMSLLGLRQSLHSAHRRHLSRSDHFVEGRRCGSVQPAHGRRCCRWRGPTGRGSCSVARWSGLLWTQHHAVCHSGSGTGGYS